jgi:[acyl-carrier-protein] S-malonyltransferase
MSIAMIFPGQGSQSPGMQSALAERYPVVASTYAEASEVLGYDLWTLVQDAPAGKLAETTLTQPAMLAAGVAAWRAWEAAGGKRPAQMAGHSLGEYSALVCAGAMEYPDAVRVVKRRAELMQAAVPAGAGAMAALLGLADDDVVAQCSAVSGSGVVEAVNFNAPGQVVIAGETAAVHEALAQAKNRGARRAIMLPVSVPAHSSLMRGASVALAGVLAKTALRAPAIPVVSAATTVPYAGAEDIRRLLAEQLYRPVRWTGTIAAMSAAGADRYIECGPGKVLAGLVRRIDKSLPVFTIEDGDSLEAAIVGLTR